MLQCFGFSDPFSVRALIRIFPVICGPDPSLSGRWGLQKKAVWKAGLVWADLQWYQTAKAALA